MAANRAHSYFRASIFVVLSLVSRSLHGQNELRGDAFVYHVKGLGYSCTFPRSEFAGDYYALWSCDTTVPLIAWLDFNRDSIEVPVGFSQHLSMLSPEYPRDLVIARNLPGITSNADERARLYRYQLYDRQRLTVVERKGDPIKLSLDSEDSSEVLSLQNRQLQPKVYLAGDFSTRDLAALIGSDGSDAVPRYLAGSSHLLAVQVPSFGSYSFTINSKRLQPLRLVGIAYRQEVNRLIAEVDGVYGLLNPFTLTMVNRSPDSVIQGGNVQVVTIEPSEIGAQSSYSFSREIVSDFPTQDVGRAKIDFYLGNYAASFTQQEVQTQYEHVAEVTSKALAGWMDKTGIEIAKNAQSKIEVDVAGTLSDLKKIRSREKTFGVGDQPLRDLVASYCFDLRDRHLGPLAIRSFSSNRSTNFSLLKFQTPNTSISEEEVSHYPFVDYLRSFFAGKDFVALGKIELKSVPERATIFIDDNRPKGFTNRVFAVNVGDHSVMIKRPNSATCSWRISVQTDETVSKLCPGDEH